ncbi:unnamed protein product [Rotaria sp. Silwood1]|nr:unnamed protein product [Rotaria sp. Silwood1]CAF1379661.1 unnamed protein product [Rotaria sp. Silwood1]
MPTRKHLSSRHRHRHNGKSSKKHSKESSETRRTSRSRSPVRYRSSTADKERKSIQTSTNQTTSIITTTNEPLNKETEQKRLEEEIQKRKIRVEQWRAERRIMLGIDKVRRQSAAQATKSKFWSLENECDDDDEEDLQNVCIPSVSLKRDVAAVRKTYKQQEAIERATQAAACTTVEKIDDDEDDPLDRFMESITKEVKDFRENNNKGSIIQIVKKTIKNESVESSGIVLTANDHDDGLSIVKTEPMDTNDQTSLAPSLVTIRSGVAKSAKEKGLIMEQDMDGLEYSSEEEITESNEDLDSISGMNSKKSKLDMMITNHDKIYYRPFRKEFYTAISEIANMTEAEVAAYRKELDDINVVGKRCPRPIKTWSQCITSTKILQVLKKLNYENPTPIQAQALPIILSGRNMIGISKTGSGKTLAFLLPMFRHIIDQPSLNDGDGPIAIIMTPTRELALQTTRECKKFAKLFDIRCIAVYGGTSISEQIAQLKRGAEIIVCTPGRLVDMLTANNGRVTNVRRVTYIIVDEADRMFDMGFEPQVTKILHSIRHDRQIVMFSATFPKKMEALMRKNLYKPIEVTVGGRSIVCKDIIQNIVIFDDDDEQKYLKLLELLGIYQPQGSILVFVDTQEHCDELMNKLMSNLYPCMSLHGGIDQYDRDSIITDFKNGDIPLLIATSVAARGLDVKNLTLVINYDCPNHYEDYVHRCGRTGRAGHIGYAYTFITPTQERYAGNIIEALKTSNAPIPEELTLLWDNYVKKVKAMGIEVKVGSGGFSGHGSYEFNSSEIQLKKKQKSIQAVAMGLADFDEEEESQVIDQQIQSLFNKSKINIKTNDKTLVNQNEETNGSTTVNDIASKLKLATQVAARLTFTKSETRDAIQEATTSLFQHGGILNTGVSNRIVAQQRANELNRKLHYEKPEEEIQVTLNVSKIFQEELEINDFPQNVRSKILSKETRAHICEYADVDISVHGQYFSNNKEVTQDDRKLYLHIESSTAYSLQLAKEEITRLIKEEMMKMQNPALQLVNRGRYKV